MKICQVCQTENPDSEGFFCAQCGSKLKELPKGVVWESETRLVSSRSSWAFPTRLSIGITGREIFIIKIIFFKEVTING